MLLDDFSKWLRINSTLSETTIGKYKAAVRCTSNEMVEQRVIHKNLVDMNLAELEAAMFLIFNNSDFIAKNRKGHNMYSNAVKHYRCFALDVLDRDVGEAKIVETIINSSEATTEKEAIVKSRIGQGTYRDKLIQKYKSRCIITGIDNKKLLIASHIKPWSVSNNFERVDEDNGLLLCANMDRLFDSGLITFDNDGCIKISSFVGKENEKRLSIEPNMKFDLQITSKMKIYLDYHRDVLYIK